MDSYRFARFFCMPVFVGLRSSAAVSLLRVGCLLVAMISFSHAWAACTANSEYLIGNAASWTDMSGVYVGTGEPPSPVGVYRFAVRVETDGSGNISAQRIVAKAFSDYPSSGASPSGPWLTSVEPVDYPHVAWFYSQLQSMWVGGGFGACLAQSMVNLGGIGFVFNGNIQYGMDLSPLAGDFDGDGTANLGDVDQRITCYFGQQSWTGPSCDNVDWLDIVSENPELDDPTFSPPPDTDVSPAPYVKGGFSASYACDTALAFGGSTIPAYSAYVGANGANGFAIWAKQYWKDPTYFGVPVVAKPYQGSFNMIRAGVGGGQTAYFSACWGKRVTYLLSGATSATFGTSVRLGDSTVWHRYVICGGQASFQYWHSGSNCWKHLGVSYTTPSDGGGTTNAVSSLLGWPGANALALIPDGYLPGDVTNETQSNVVGGEYRLPMSSVTSYYDSGKTTSIGGGGSGTSLSISGVQQGVYNALVGAARGQAGENAAAMGRAMGQGAGGAAEDIYGAGGSVEGDGGAAADAESSAVADVGGFSTAMQDALALDDLSPDSQGEYAWNVSIPRPGGGAIAFELSTRPDTGTTMGLALESVRLLIRLGVFVWFTLVYGRHLVQLYKGVT